jgi:gamma-glutamylcyclotransferase (GGCT)/AIG2-like uncharacterized protein YtfP
MSTNSIFLCTCVADKDFFLGRIQNFIVSTETAMIQAAVYRSKIGFPVLLKQGADEVQGILVHLNATDLATHLVDELMGYFAQDPAQGLTYKELVPVHTDAGVVETHVYFLNPAKLNSDVKYIENGDWQQALSEMPPIPKKLNERQRNYIQKLGKSSGRDIVPIDLALYRELMNLELVIDKGRRIALTNCSCRAGNT